MIIGVKLQKSGVEIKYILCMNKNHCPYWIQPLIIEIKYIYYVEIAGNL